MVEEDKNYSKEGHKCYFCNQEKLEIIRNKLRYDVKRNVFECKNCGFVYLEPKPISKEYYSEEYRKLYTPILGKKLKAKEIFKIFLPYQQKHLNNIKHLLNLEIRALDIGCSSGHFLYTIKNYVKECIGIELNKEEAEFASNLGFKIYTKPVQETDLPKEYFDLITIFQVLEHIEDPISFLKNVYRYLKPGGFLVIEVPNIQDALISLYNIEEYSDFWFREPHLFYYSSKTLSALLNKCGFLGEMHTSQNFNLLNHLNRILNKKPQKDNVEMSKPILVKSSSKNTLYPNNLKVTKGREKGINKLIEKEFNQWFEGVNENYKKLLNKHNLGENILFIGKKIVNEN